MKQIVLALLIVVVVAVAPLSAHAADYEKTVADATNAYVQALEAAKKQAAAAGETKAAESIQAKIDSATDKPAIIGKWGWYKGVSTVKADGTCHWKGPNHEEHGMWRKAEGYFFNWGEHNNDWNYLSVDADGHLSGKGVKWGGPLKSEGTKKAE